jgi:hypothetical protein
MIYFSDPQKSKQIKSYFNSLNIGGYLVIGKTETLTGDTRNIFVTVNGIESIYQRSKAFTRNPHAAWCNTSRQRPKKTPRRHYSTERAEDAKLS